MFLNLSFVDLCILICYALLIIRKKSERCILEKFERNLSKGSVARQLITFSLPFLISNIIQSLYGVCDMIIVGRFTGTASMSAVNIAGQVTFILTNMVFGLCVGATVLIGQYLGANAKEEMKQTIGTLYTTLLFCSVLITIIMLIFCVPVLHLINTPAEAFDEARRYLNVTMLGTIFIFGYNACSAIMRGLGDSRRPLVFVSIACVINIFFDLLLVAVFDMGAYGAAIATVFSQGVSLILCIIYLKRNNFIFDFKIKSFKIHRKRLQMLLKVGIPTCVQNVVVGLSFLFLTAMVNTLGVTSSAAVGAVGKFNGFAIMPAVAMSSSISAMSAHNIGADEQKRAVKTLRIGVVIALSISIVLFALIRLFPDAILRIFADDDAMVANGLQYIYTFSYDYLIVPLLFCLNGLFIGSGHTTFSLINSLMSSVLIRVPAAYFFGFYLNMGLKGVGLGSPIASALSLIVSLCFFFSGKWKHSIVIKGLNEERLATAAEEDRSADRSLTENQAGSGEAAEISPAR